MSSSNLKGIWNNLCNLCYQPSEQLICDVCRSDVHCYDWSSWGFNLLNRVDIAKGFKVVEFNHLMVFGEYRPPLSDWIQQYKFGRSVLSQKILRELLLSHFSRHPIPYQYDMIICVPLHHFRWLTRSYNQADFIAKCLQKAFGFNCEANLLKRTKFTAPQTHLTAAARNANLSQAFAISGKVEGKSVLLVDDVITTGSTVNAACKLLKQHGAKCVDVVALAIAKA